MIRFRLLTDIILPAILMCWIAVLGYSALVGDYSYRSLEALEGEIGHEKEILETARSQRVYLERRANLMSSQSLDPDMIDEQIRRTLGYSREGDIVVPRSVIER